jgi:hypothetical protein
MRGSVAAGCLPALGALCALSLGAAAPAWSQGQVFTVEPEHVEKHYTEFTPTHVRYPEEPLTTLDKEELIRFMQAEHGFAMRPLPIANLILHANGHMDPTGDRYVDLLHAKGISVKPGDGVVVTDIKFREKSIEIDLNGGPEHKHKYLRHISIGMDPYNMTPLAQDSGAPPTGSRVTLEFEEQVPNLNGEQLEALLKPMIDFGVKSPAEAYAESLPPFLRKAIIEHRVLVGMDRDMVRWAKGEPDRKVRETDAQGKAFEVWIYGEVPQPVEFVRFVGPYVVRVELAKVGEPIVARTANEMGDYWGNQPAVKPNEHEIELGDRTQQDETQENAPREAPTLRKPGDPQPAADQSNPAGQMGPVNFPPDQRRPGDPGYTPPPAQPTGSGTSGSGSSTGSASGSGAGTQSSSGSGQTSGKSSGQTGSGQQQGSGSSQPQGNGSSQPQGSGSSQPNPLDQPQ